MEAPTTRVSQPKFNTDESILSVRLSGEATNAFGVDITEEPKVINNYFFSYLKINLDSFIKKILFIISLISLIFIYFLIDILILII